ncbi:thermonuclease family protein [Salinicoccus roseus]|uniref:thermonuclease family protein n=1 Tax=Salinicoccus roseus TaxID=45670 RepID=UPI0023011CC6|nr:thermonuclease family protein [Salinicoccus roseus]
MFLGVVATITLFVRGLVRENKGQAYHSTWKAALYSFVATCLLVVLLGVVSSEYALADMVGILWLFVSIAMFVFIVLALRSKSKNQNPRRHFRRAGIAFVTGLALFFVTVAVTDEVEEPVDQTASADEDAEKVTEEATEEEIEEESKEDSEEEEAAAEAEKEKEESIEAEKEASIEAAEKEKEESIEAEREKEESIEEASIEAEKEKSIEEAEAKAKAEEEPVEEPVASKEGLIPVSLYRVVDGDTVNVIDDSGQELKLRLLLIDTPETVHPNKPVEPYGKEASARLTELLNAADQLYIEYDSGDKTDHYDRHLVYLYADDVSVHEVLLKEGLARVGYIYEQQRYLSEFRAAEQYAKDRGLGIWSIPGYVNEGGEGFNSEEPEPEPEPTSEPATSEPATSEPQETTEYFQNCTELKKVYPDGVASDHAAYQSKMDRDKDNWACE